MAVRSVCPIHHLERRKGDAVGAEPFVDLVLLGLVALEGRHVRNQPGAPAYVQVGGELAHHLVHPLPVPVEILHDFGVCARSLRADGKDILGNQRRDPPGVVGVCRPGEPFSVFRRKFRNVPDKRLPYVASPASVGRKAAPPCVLESRIKGVLPGEENPRVFLQFLKRNLHLSKSSYHAPCVNFPHFTWLIGQPRKCPCLRVP